ncbi:MAG: hypothetical protein AAB037_00495 [Chloroflexota bacterium]
MSQQKVEKKEEANCSQCGATSHQRPLVSYEFKGQEKRVCVRCLPMLIHGGADA